MCFDAFIPSVELQQLISPDVNLNVCVKLTLFKDGHRRAFISQHSNADVSVSLFLLLFCLLLLYWTLIFLTSLTNRFTFHSSQQSLLCKSRVVRYMILSTNKCSAINKYRNRLVR